MIGKTLGHYRVGEQLGRGGMGEVYLADDLNLNRKVALKFLPDAFTGDPERMARFEREAKLLASLNHPNIAAIYGLEEAEGKRFLVLELVEGETLAQRLSKGPLPLDEALGICRQIAEGLEAAHEKGVIHRDLKPANVMITEGDKVKILDFGLAKALSDETRSVDSSHSPTITEAMTRPGIVLGTAAYMSPEQAKGKAVDKRADNWAFGCILYECLAGKRAFEGETVTETLASVLTREPEFDRVPLKVKPLLRRCLEKDLKKRLRDIGDIGALLESEPESAPARRSWLAWTWIAIATLLAVALAVPVFRYFRSQKTPEAMLFHEAVPPMSEYFISISPDGHAIAYVAPSAGTTSLFLRMIDSGTTRKLNGTEGAQYPFWSPDSRSIAFGAGERLKRIDVSGGSLRDVCPLRYMSGGTWNSDGIIIFGDVPDLKRVPADGGEPGVIAAPDTSQGEVAYASPYFLPDGRHFVYSTALGSESRGIYLGSIDSKERIRLLTTTSMAAYADPGYLLFQRGETLFARPFDAKNFALGGEEISIASGLLPHTFLFGTAIFGVSQNGMLLYRAGEVQVESQFTWFDRTGKQLGPAGEPGTYRQDFDLSPDGKQIAVTQLNPGTNNADVRLIEWVRNVSTRLTFNKEITSDVIWSPDGGSKDRKHWLLFLLQVTSLDPGHNSLRALTRLLII